MVKKFTVKGLVQGIGYRPWVARLAEELNIDGWVRNTGGVVTVLASGDEDRIDELGELLSTDVPTGGFVTSVEVEDIFNSDEISQGFKILSSNQDVKANLPLVPADIATCDRCKEELFNPNDRRYLHPFISCTICGPRYSIIERLPYDRDTITMGDFDMCLECEKEYTAKADRRRHAQTIACMDCGPKLTYKLISEKITTDILKNAGNLADTLACRNFRSKFLEKSDKDKQILEDMRIKVPELYQAIMHIENGGILALKDIGGYHLICNPFDENAVANLRLLKHREAKAFAVMFYDVDKIREYCSVNRQESDLLKSAARPIVLLKRNQTGIKKLADNVCLTSPSIGAMLPCNPVQIILAKICGPLIMTSGNASGDVLETDDARMEKWLTSRAKSEELKGVPIAMLSHNRRILRPMDDSVMKIVKGRQQFIRRGRGHAPSPILVDVDGEVFAAGGDLKASFCYVKNGLAYVSQYLGDMESVSCQKFYHNEKHAMTTIFGFAPKKIVVDKHPGYFSRKDGMAFAKQLETKEIQHHKAHVASVIAEHNLKGSVLGFAFDGTGYGDDGTVWGSEIFLWDGKSMVERVAHLKPIKLIGGDEGAKNCDTILAGMLYGNNLHIGEETTETRTIKAAIDNNINTVISTSMGRLFDAVSALLDICHYNSYEGQAPIELENEAAKVDDVYPLSFGKNGDTEKLLKDIVYAISAEVDIRKIARGFIYAIADYIEKVADAHISRLDENKQIVLSGGTFLNTILLERAISNLESKGYNVYISNKLPPGDGGICLGQAYLSQK